MRRCVWEERGNIWRKHHRWIVQRKLRGSKHPIDIFVRSVAFDCHPTVKMLGVLGACLITIERLETFRVTWPC
jgi:hypothetical protein